MENINRIVEGIDYQEYKESIWISFNKSEIREKTGNHCYGLIVDLTEQSSKNIKNIVIDMTAVELITSSPLGKLNMLLKFLSNKGIQLLICGVEKEVLNIFELMQLTRIFNIVSVQEAEEITNR
tara:strand:- start:211 stop:582 length:372 start_codon:yes stop_codon:yes gene_type:complete